MPRRCKNWRGECQATYGANYLASNNDEVYVNTVDTWGGYNGFIMLRKNLGISTTYLSMYYARSMEGI